MKRVYKLIILLLLLFPLSVFGLVKQSQYKYVTDEANIMSDELVEDDNDLNLDVMKDIWINNQINLNEKNIKSNVK